MGMNRPQEPCMLPCIINNFKTSTVHVCVSVYVCAGGFSLPEAHLAGNEGALINL